MPAAAASSTTYWIVGGAGIGGSSFGTALAAGSMRVPNPAAGMTVLVIIRRGSLLDALGEETRMEDGRWRIEEFQRSRFLAFIHLPSSIFLLLFVFFPV